MGCATPILVILIALFAIIIFRRCFADQMKKWGYVISSKVLTVDENLPNFFSAVKISDKDWFVKESRYFREHYKFTFANKAVVDRLADDKNCPKKPIQGVPFYNILCNPSYTSDFCYVTCSVDNRSDFIVDNDDNEDNDNEQSDMVALLINLAYVRVDVAKKF